MYKTKNDLPETSRSQVIDLLAPHLANVLDLALQAKHAHWNVKGPSFIALHELYDKVAAAAQTYADDLAERIAQLGGTPNGLVKHVAARSKLPAFLMEDASVDKVEGVSSALAFVGSGVRRDIEEAIGHGDIDTSDLLTEISRDIDKQHWLVEAHAQVEVPRPSAFPPHGA